MLILRPHLLIPLINLTTNPLDTNLTNVNNFSVKWTGFVNPLYSETYTFYVDANSGVRVWVDNTLLIDQWTNASATEYSGTIAVTAGTPYPIRVEYNNTATASMALSWSSNSQIKQVIPSVNLYPANQPDTSNGIDLMDGLN